MVVDVGLRVEAERGFADELGVLGYGREIEWALEACRAFTWQLEGRALREAIGIVRGGLGAEYIGVHGPAGVDVKIAEECLPQWLVGGAASELDASAGLGQAIGAVAGLGRRTAGEQRLRDCEGKEYTYCLLLQEGGVDCYTVLIGLILERLINNRNMFQLFLVSEIIHNVNWLEC